MGSRYPSVKNILRGCFYFVFLLLMHRVSLENVPVVAYTGGTVILPCSSNDNKLQRDDAGIFWRQNDSNTVLDIKGGRVSFNEQEALFRNRVDSFPEEYTKGNFSIRLRDVKLSDAGMYSCFMPDIEVETTLPLIVKEYKCSDQSAGAGNGDVRGRSDSVLLFFTSLLGFFVLHP